MLKSASVAPAPAGPAIAQEDPVIHDMNHFTVLTDDLDRTLAFYGRLGLAPGPRPPFDFPGAWLYAGDDRAILHVIAGQELPSPAIGVLDHMAFSARGLKGVKDWLDAEGVPYDLRRLPGSGLWQLFCHDPNGAKVELDFEASESA
jgi:catechol 2,3-dioxygenase-like lactoylglutathione lyase family enzyme